ncbi:thymidine kinase [Candidatus Falkowbacteria bacterium CG10_big_fil_rev_8_21_14_0_10_37_14]|uniref:Thymidine kinase n=1 Tax=Candidatus Falkowbacteria bacterium CG10_big_fil_rev_8_21_14_0_10_37_14 TaxID=1974561 RepID=A0A2M6WTK6_9BACT|nr:thymidine kinase [Candidatus Falkowbacteria bacterium]PIT96118.1 MAG: thymidine kinase [Candidatus Falkowbacteria bacterium CG10_big_fil_rev_8_21_14_0_10_37_14]
MSYLEVITGPMFSGKSEELIRIIKRTQYAKLSYLVIKPLRDTRQDTVRARFLDHGKSKTLAEHPAHPVNSSQQFFKLLSEHQPIILIIDEAHFLGNWIIKAVNTLLKENDLRIYVAGLDQTAWGDTFGPMGDLMAMAHVVKKLTAVCFNCGQEATKTFKLFVGASIVDPGDAEKYEARCLKCWHQPL